QVTVGAGGGAALPPAIDSVAGVVRHAGVLPRKRAVPPVAAVGGRSRRVVAGILRARPLLGVTPRSAHTEDSPPSRWRRRAADRVWLPEARSGTIERVDSVTESTEDSSAIPVTERSADLEAVLMGA